MQIGTFEFEATLFRWQAQDAWHFVALPQDVSEDIADLTAGRRGGFGSVRVEVSVATSTWRTSVFPDSTRGVFVLPMKKAVRTAQGLQAGDVAHVRLRLVDL